MVMGAIERIIVSLVFGYTLFRDVGSIVLYRL